MRPDSPRKGADGCDCPGEGALRPGPHKELGISGRIWKQDRYVKGQGGRPSEGFTGVREREQWHSWRHDFWSWEEVGDAEDQGQFGACS